MRVRSLNVVMILACCGLALANDSEFTLPSAQSGQIYQADLTEVLRQNGVRIESDAASPRLRWSMDAKEAPDGLKLLADGTLTGTPQATQRQIHRLTVQVQDENLGPDSLSIPFLLTVEPPRLRLVRTAPRLAPLAKPQPSTSTAPAPAASAPAQSGGGSVQTASSGTVKVTLDMPKQGADKLTFRIEPPLPSMPEVLIWVEESSELARKEAKEKGTCPKDKYPQSFKQYIEASHTKPPGPSPLHRKRQKEGTLEQGKEPGQYSIQLFQALDACDAVLAQVIVNGTEEHSPPVLAETVPKPKVPVLQADDLVEGSKSVSGSTSKEASVEISVNDQVEKTATADKTTGKFKVELDEALKAGDKVGAKATLKGASAKSEAHAVYMKPVLNGENVVGDKDKVAGSTPKGAKIEIQVNKVTLGTTTETTDGGFSVELDGTLKAGDKVVAKATLNGVSIESEPVTARLKTALSESKLIEGEKTVSGRATKGAKVEIEVNEDLKEDGTADDDGTFDIELDNALGAGDRVVAKATLEDVTIASDTLVVRSQTIDLGRSRFFFSTGVILSKENEDFSEQDPFLAFNWVTNWLRTKPRIWEGGDNGLGKLQMSRFWINSFMDIQLTSIPVEMEGMPDPDANKIAPRQEEGGGNGDGGNGDDPLETFLSSRQSALIQGGFYFPFVTTVWKNPNPNALFLAPIIKVGVQTTTEDDGMTMEEGPNRRVPGLGTDDVFNFFSFGARVGHWDLSDLLSNSPDQLDRGRTPRMLSYLDILFGRWENFEVFRLNENQDQIRKRPWRFALEGRLKIPKLPLYVGMDANLSIEQGDDDVRFLFGTNFDIDKLFGKLSIPK